jgi:hypothetical protein
LNLPGFQSQRIHRLSPEESLIDARAFLAFG